MFAEPDNPIFYLRITNNGKSAARNLRLKMNRSFQQFGHSGDSNNISKFPAFQNEIASFPPGAELTFALAQGFKVFENDEESEDLPRKFSVVAEYWYGNKDMREEHLVDLSAHKKSGIPQDPIIRKLKDIKELDKTINGNS